MDKEQYYYKIVKVNALKYLSLLDESPYICEYIIGETTVPRLKGSKLFVFDGFRYAGQFKRRVVSSTLSNDYAILKGTAMHISPIKETTNFSYLPNNYPLYWEVYHQLIHDDDIFNQWMQQRYNEIIVITAPTGTILVDSFTPIAVVDE